MLAIAACAGPGAPTPTPDDMVGLLAELSAHGFVVRDQVAGDAGCADPTLRDNAMRLALSYEGGDFDVYLFRWRRASDHATAAGAFATCAESFAGTAGGSVATVDVAPWRAFGAGWSAAMTAALEGSFAAAAGR